jgi:hypothetical protein
MRRYLSVIVTLGECRFLTKEVNRLFWLKTGGSALILIFLLVICLYFLKIKLFLDLSVKGKNMEFKVEVFIWRFRVFKTTIPSLDIEEDPFEIILKSHNNITGTENIGLSSKEWGPLWHKMKDIWGVVKKQKRLSRIFYISNFSWKTAIGCDQADRTAMITGVMWTVKSNVIGLLYSMLQMNGVTFDVNPRFNQWVFETHFSCMISFRLGKAIGQVFRIRRQYKKRRLHRGRASHSRVNEDSA